MCVIVVVAAVNNKQMYISNINYIKVDSLDLTVFGVYIFFKGVEFHLCKLGSAAFGGTIPFL